MANVTLEGVRKIYEERGRTSVAVHDVTVTVADGEFLVLVGPSGCGKSTTLRMIAGLESVSAGTIKIGDRVVNHVPARDRDIAMVFQNYALYPHMTVYQNLAFALTMRRTAKTDIDARVRQAAALLELEPLLDRRPRQLSGGQRQRIAAGRAIVRQPQVFLFDEPLSNLDASCGPDAPTWLPCDAAWGDTIYVTHDQVEAMTLGDRIVVMRDGRVQQTDAPLALYRQPANTFVATFLGTPPMNLLRGTVTAGEAPAFQADGGGLRLPLAGGPHPASGRPVIVGIRPEDFRLGASAAAGVSAWVAEVEPLGNETLVSLDADGVALTARLDGAAVVRRGDPVTLTVAPESLHWFDAKSENRL
jgi:multiple sugar transport system ATP-binding protein